MQNSERPPLILASGSPRRRELMERFWGIGGIQVMPPVYDESAIMVDDALRLDVRTMASKLAAGKMAALHSQFDLPQNFAAFSADTLVALDDVVMGKPSDQADAIRMLRLLSGRTHQVISGICLDACCQGKLFSQQATEITNVRFARLTDEQIDWYAATGEPLDKAGAYGIQGFGAALVRQIDGCYYNVMGLPVNRLMVMLQQAANHFSSTSVFNQLLPWN